MAHRPGPQGRAQNEIQRIVRDIRREGLTNSCWSAPLQAAPSALLALGTCLKAASLDGAKSIKVNHSKSGNDESVVQLPYEYLESNLERCANLGWEAFNTAESGMRNLFYNAEGMLGVDGTLAVIVRLLDDPETARYHLRGNLDDVRDSAMDCKKEAEKIKGNFEYLVNYIAALQEATIETKNHTIEEKQEKDAEAARVKSEEKDHEIEQERLEGVISKLEDELEESQISQKVAQEAVDEISEAEDDQVITLAEITSMLDGEAPPPTNDPTGVFTDIRNFLFGKSESVRRKERESEKEWRDRRDKMLKELLEARRVEIDNSKAAALKKLQEAQGVAQQRQAALDSVQERYQVNVREHLIASRARKSAHDHLERLLKQRSNLSDIEDIINESLTALRSVTENLRKLHRFFQEIEDAVKALATSLEQKFLRPIENSVQQSGNAAGAEVIEDFSIAPGIKRSLLNNALGLVGRYSLAYDIARVYVNVSKRFINPGIDMLGRLNGRSMTQAQANFAELVEWEREAVAEIARLAVEDRRGMNGRMAANVRLLALEANMITAAEERQMPQEADVEEL